MLHAGAHDNTASTVRATRAKFEIQDGNIAPVCYIICLAGYLVKHGHWKLKL